MRRPWLPASLSVLVKISTRSLDTANRGLCTPGTETQRTEPQRTGRWSRGTRKVSTRVAAIPSTSAVQVAGPL
jgi:hypothetical protein